LKELKDYASAVECFNTIIKINPFYLNGYLSKELAMKELKNFNDALIQFDKALEIDPNFSAAYNSKICLLKF